MDTKLHTCLILVVSIGVVFFLIALSYPATPYEKTVVLTCLMFFVLNIITTIITALLNQASFTSLRDHRESLYEGSARISEELNSVREILSYSRWTLEGMQDISFRLHERLPPTTLSEISHSLGNLMTEVSHHKTCRLCGAVTGDQDHEENCPITILYLAHSSLQEISEAYPDLDPDTPIARLIKGQ